MGVWLEKRGAINTGFKRRWFVLDVRARTLTYWRDPPSADGGADTSAGAAGSVALRGASVHVLATDARGRATLEIAAPEHARVFVIRGLQPEILLLAAELRAAIAGAAAEDAPVVEAGSSSAVLLGAPSTSGTLPGETPALSSSVAEPEIGAVADDCASQIFKEGWLEKKGAVMARWRRRWFVLRYGRLDYYRQPSDPTPRGTVLLPEGLSRLVPEAETAAASGAASSTISLLEIRSVMGNRAYLLRGPTTELSSWLAALVPRHSDPRANWALSAVGITAMPAPADTASKAAAGSRPVVVDPRALRPVYSSLTEALRRAAAGPQLCRLFCGGANCKHCNPERWLACTAIRGVNATWVTHDRLAMSRPVQPAISEFRLPSQLSAADITAIFNVQQPGEHASCGPPLVDGLFSYDPALFLSVGIVTDCCGWEDYGTPEPRALLATVRRMQRVLDGGHKVAVHCHAGLGRTGLLLACSIVFGLHYGGEEAVALVRQRRQGSLQTSEQVQAVLDFAANLAILRTVIVPPASRPVPLEVLLVRYADISRDAEAPHSDAETAQSIIAVPSYLRHLLGAITPERTSGLESVLEKMEDLLASTTGISEDMAASTRALKTSLNRGFWAADDLATVPVSSIFLVLCEWLEQLTVPLALDTEEPGARAVQFAVASWATGAGLGPLALARFLMAFAGGAAADKSFLSDLIEDSSKLKTDNLLHLPEASGLDNTYS